MVDSAESYALATGLEDNDLMERLGDGCGTREDCLLALRRRGVLSFSTPSLNEAGIVDDTGS